MKKRLMFVTNSSSSSYVVSFNAFTPEEKDFLSTNEVVLEKILLLEKAIFGEDVSKITTKEQLNECFLNAYFWQLKNKDIDIETLLNDESNSDEKEEYDIYLKEINEGKSIYFVSIDYSDEQTEDKLNILKKAGLLTFLQENY